MHRISQATSIAGHLPSFIWGMSLYRDFFAKPDQIIRYLIWQYPSSILMQKLPHRLWCRVHGCEYGIYAIQSLQLMNRRSSGNHNSNNYGGNYQLCESMRQPCFLRCVWDLYGADSDNCCRPVFDEKGESFTNFMLVCGKSGRLFNSWCDYILCLRPCVSP